MSFSISPRQDNQCVPVHIPAKRLIPKPDSKVPIRSQLRALEHGDIFTMLYIHGDTNVSHRAVLPGCTRSALCPWCGDGGSICPAPRVLLIAGRCCFLLQGQPEDEESLLCHALGLR